MEKGLAWFLNEKDLTKLNPMKKYTLLLTLILESRIFPGLQGI
jgi:hypothetical protein